MSRLSVLALALSALVPTAAASDPGDPAVRTRVDGEDDLRAALTGGEVTLRLRLRSEFVDAQGFSEDALANTLRTVFGYRTGSWNGLRAAFEFEDTATLLDDEYNSTVNGKTTYPTVLDPAGSGVNQAYVVYDGLEHTEVQLGRQELVLDNARFIGNVGWRQNHQSYDGLVAVCTALEGLTATYAYLDDVNRITGATLESESHVLNVGYDVGELGRVTGYLYRLDVQSAPALASSTVGLRLDGSRTVQDDLVVRYTAEFANQSDIGANPNDVDADYTFLQLGVDTHGVALHAGLETLGDTSGAASSDAFQTPFATLHGHNGYADVFAPGTPDDGLEDLRFGVAGVVGPVEASLTYHVFSSDENSVDYGDELDLVLSHPVNDHTKVSLKVADFSADSAGGLADVTKVMVWLDYAIR